MPKSSADSFYSDEKDHQEVHVRVEVFFCSRMIQQEQKRVRAMDQPGAVAKKSTIIEDVAVRACELRLERRSLDTHGKERVEYLCGASGGPEHGYVLGVAREDISAMVAICNACPIPDALEASRSCLNLVPVRRFPGGKRSLPMLQSSMQTPQSSQSADAYFPCHWFYTLYGQHQPRDTTVSRSCTHWFPRPPRELNPITGLQRKRCCGSSTVKNRRWDPQPDLALVLGKLPVEPGGGASCRRYTCE